MTNENVTHRRTAWELWLRNGLIWAALMLLLTASLVLAYIPMGLFTPAAGIIVAIVKAAIVMLLFMELIRSKTLIHLAALAGLVFLATLFTLTLADVLTRVGPK